MKAFIVVSLLVATVVTAVPYVPVDTPEVQQAKAAHFAAFAKAGGAQDYTHTAAADLRYDGRYGYHIPQIHNGVPVEPAAVQHARAEHLAKVAAVPHSSYQEPESHGHYVHQEEQHTAKYDGRYGYHIPTIHNGVPVEPEAVQHARAAHLAKVAATPVNYHHHAKRSADYDGRYGYHIPQIHNGVPVEPAAVQQARAAHLAKLGTPTYNHVDNNYHAAPVHSEARYDGRYGYHIPTIHNGVPVEPEAVQHARAEHLAKAAHASGHHGVVDTPEVQHARAQHFAAVNAASSNGHATHDNDDGSWHPSKYV